MINLEQISTFLRTKWHLPILISIVLYIIGYIIENWEYLRAVNECVTLKRTVRGDISRCFRTPKDTCQELHHGYTFGWCNDPDNYGALPGNIDGPYIGTCSTWSWKKKDCPPISCKGNYPYGIKGQKPFQKWGWCADEGVNRSMIGSQCGPRDETCQNWIWDESVCPNTCPNRQKRRLKKRKPKLKKEKVCGKVCGTVNGKKVECPPKCFDKKKNKCSTQCGMINGVWIDCPPPPCVDDKCICK